MANPLPWHRETIHENVSKADQKVTMQVDNIAGVMLPEFKLFKDPDVKTSNILPGLAKGGEAVIKAKNVFQKALEVLVALAGLQTSFMLLDEAIKVKPVTETGGPVFMLSVCVPIFNTVPCRSRTAG